ncbi:MAG: BmrU protein, partial [Clostridiales bacterium]|nr:BmrU protein [Clostridiales bacterium]
MKHIFIINPAAGKRDNRQRVYAMAEALEQKHGLDVSCMLTKSHGHATQLTRSIAETGEAVRFYACGGDGTVNEVANGIAGFDNAAMTVIPIGTGNDFLKNFGPEMLPKFMDAENLWNGEVQQLDLIDCNGKACLTIACSGIDARIAESVHDFSSSISGKGAYLASVAVNFIARGIGQHLTV